MSGDYNFYRYVSNDPANNLDALGLAKCNQKKLEKKLNQAKGKVASKLKSLNKLKSMAAKKAAKKVATLPLKAVPFLGWAMAAYDVYDTVTTGIDIYDMVKEYDAAADAVEEAGKKLADCKKKKAEDKKDGAKITDAGDPPGTFRDKNGKLRNKDGTFAKDPKTVKFNRSMSERKKALLRDANDPNSGLTKEQRKFIIENKGNKVPEGLEVSHEKPLYTAKTLEGKRELDIADNMKTQNKIEHRARHAFCGDQYHRY